ncbi:MAG: CopG family transcriptional regulator [Nitrospinae bacterium]|nr:CopG family transcriptional regulator [Nitrospinota bacterium]
MEKQNITLSLPKTLLKKAKSMAAIKGSSISEIVKETLEEKIGAESGYQGAKNRQIALMKKCASLGGRGRIPVSRDELHERR